MKLEERLFTPQEVAERLGMSKYTITEWIKAGRLKGVKIGKYWRVKERDLQAFIDNPPPLQRHAPVAKGSPSGGPERAERAERSR
jgi:excisionase family DNA binding protein